MKKVILLIGVLMALIIIKSYAQKTEGAIEYESKTNLHRRLTGDRESMRAMVPEFRSTKELLLFNQEATLYKPIIEDDEDEISGGGGSMRMRFPRPQNEIYLDRDSQVRTLLNDFMGKKYVITDTLNIQPWKFGNGERDVLGYVCKMAFYQDTVRNLDVTAWYTTDLPPFVGPEGFNTLPGTVLAVDINNSERILVARKVSIRPLKKNEMKKPEKGEKMSKEEYDAMVKEQVEKMRASGAGFRMGN